MPNVVVSSTGSPLPRNKTVTWKGICAVHDDSGTKAWCYDELAAALYRDGPRQASFRRFLDSPRRVILEVEPVQRIGFDGAKMRSATDAWMAGCSPGADHLEGG